ncbi:MAG: NYN domain-containing protein [Gemmatimonadaceae bacterium]|nr:NYN domain-containing protein [Gemmatimonadaceae bacterium]
MSHQNTGSHTIHHAPNAALLIDFDNVTMGIRSDLQTELKNLLASDIIKGKVSVQRAYADWRRYPQYIVPLAESSIDMIMAPAYGSAKKNATDIRLAIDALELVFVRPEIGTFILLSGDSDFSSLVIKLKEYGKYVIGVGIRESSSDLLVMNCDEYYSYNALAGLKKEGEEEVVKQDPWELVTEAVQRMKRNGDVMRADRLKQVMQQIDSSFDEKNVGKAKFSLFVSEAAKRGLLSLTKLENGQLEVDLPKTTVSHPSVVGGQDATPPAQASGDAVAVVPEEAERARRSRRGGRGRPRERDDRSTREVAPALAATTGSSDASSASAAVMGTDAIDASAIVDTDGAPAASPPAAQHRVAAVSSPPAAGSAASSDGIGSSGLRLTRDEAFDLVRRAVASSTSGNAAITAAKVRSAARSLLGRDSESLSERNFVRILHDAHDADVIDLRRRGSDYEVAAAVAAPPVDRQLKAAATANAPAPKAVAPIIRGMGARGIGRGALGARSAPPAHLMSMGMVPSRNTALTGAVTPAATTAQASLDLERTPAPADDAASSVELDRTLAAEAEGLSSPLGVDSRPASSARPARKRNAAKKSPRAASGTAATAAEPKTEETFKAKPGGNGSAPVAKRKRATAARKKPAARKSAAGKSAARKAAASSES